MIPAIAVSTLKPNTALPEEKPCYRELVERVQAIWNGICAWISALFGGGVANQRDISYRCPDAFYNSMKYLGPEDVGRCERVCRAWKIPDKVWQVQCEQEKVDPLEAKRGKGAFANPTPPPFAFGVNEWRERFGVDVGVAPRLPASIHRTIAKLKEAYLLTLIPATVDGKPFCLNTFRPLASKVGIYLSPMDQVAEILENKAQEKSIWVWMQQELERSSWGVTKQAEAEKKYKLGKALWIVVSMVAHSVSFQARLKYTRTSDGGHHEQRGPWQVVVGDCWAGQLHVAVDYDSGHPDFRVVNTFPA